MKTASTPSIAMVVSTVGYHWEEVFGAFWAFRDGGARVAMFTVDGRAPVPDPRSLRFTGPASLMGLGISRRIAPSTERGRALQKAMDAAEPLARFEASTYDAIFLPGGHGCLFDVNRSTQLHRVLERMLDRGALLGAVCHATSTFAFVKKDGQSVLRDRKVTGFPHPLDRLLIAAGQVDPRFLPLPLVNDEELRRAGARLSAFDVVEACMNPRTVRVALPFITGVGPKAAAPVARRLLRGLETRLADRSPLEIFSANVRGSATSQRVERPL